MGWLIGGIFVLILIAISEICNVRSELEKANELLLIIANQTLPKESNQEEQEEPKTSVEEV